MFASIILIILILFYFIFNSTGKFVAENNSHSIKARPKIIQNCNFDTLLTKLKDVIKAQTLAKNPKQITVELLLMMCQMIRTVFNEQNVEFTARFSKFEQKLANVCSTEQQSAKSVVQNAKSVVNEYGGIARLIQTVSSKGPKILAQLKELEELERLAQSDEYRNILKELYKLLKMLPADDAAKKLLLDRSNVLPSDIFEFILRKIETILPIVQDQTIGQFSDSSADFGIAQKQIYRRRKRNDNVGFGILLVVVLLLTFAAAAGEAFAALAIGIFLAFVLANIGGDIGRGGL